MPYRRIKRNEFKLAMIWVKLVRINNETTNTSNPTQCCLYRLPLQAL